MKKVIIPMVVLLMAGPAFATVTITCTQVGSEPNYIVSFVNDDVANNVRAFALELTVDCNVITAVDCLNTEYYIYPGKIEIEGGEVSKWGTCAVEGLDSNMVIVELSSLYALEDPDHNEAPPQDGDLFKVTLGDVACILSMAENNIRGGVVMEDPNLYPTVEFGGCGEVEECFPSADANYGDWVTYKNTYGLASVECWCEPPKGSGYQCVGDADGATSGFPYNYRVFTGDLNKLIACWKMKMGNVSLDPCADMDHKSSGFPYNYRVFTGDLNILIGNWKKKDSAWGTPPPYPCP
jgi:hypothetical protein